MAQTKPYKLGFTWGFFYLICFTISTVFLAGAILVTSVIEQKYSIFGGSFLVTAAVIFLFSQAVRRRRWALITSTFLTFNPLCYGINFFYFRNRWSEFTKEATDGSPAKRLDGQSVRLKASDKSARIALFIAATWVSAVFIFVVIFRPYGQMYPQDYEHMYMSMLIPAVSWLALYFIYRKFVK